MAFTDKFLQARDRWEAKGSPPCDHPANKREKWYDHPGMPWEGDIGCLQCGDLVESRY